MKNKFENIKVLKSEITSLLERAKELEKKLAALNPQTISPSTPEAELISIGYYITGIYSCFEDLFSKIAREFENTIYEPIRWHAELLERMSLDIEEVRPHVISKETKVVLDELRKFRHIYRFSYMFELDWEKMIIVIKRWYLSSDIVKKDLKEFTNFLDQCCT